MSSEQGKSQTFLLIISPSGLCIPEIKCTHRWIEPGSQNNKLAANEMVQRENTCIGPSLLNFNSLYEVIQPQFSTPKSLDRDLMWLTLFPSRTISSSYLYTCALIPMAQAHICLCKKQTAAAPPPLLRGKQHGSKLPPVEFCEKFSITQQLLQTRFSGSPNSDFFSP